MKRTNLVVLTIGMLTAGLAVGCAAQKSTVLDAEKGVILPPGYVPMPGLTKADYDAAGWPKYIVCRKDGSVMVLVEKTKYTMGSKNEPNELPPHEVVVGRFYIDLYEVNNAQFARFADSCAGMQCPCLADVRLTKEDDAQMAARRCQEQHGHLQADPCSLASCMQIDKNYFRNYWVPGVNDTHPARAVNFWEAWQYCRWVGKDLPTEAEWELAAKGTGNNLYPWGNIEPDSQHLLCNYGGAKAGEDGFEYSAPVAAFAAGRSPYGCYNMAGNVSEWCKDKYDASVYAATDFASGKDRQAEVTRTMTEPKGASYSDHRVVRGGSFASGIYDCRTTVRKPVRPNYHGMNIGFRGVVRIDAQD